MKKHSGFTLIEILLVAAIISVLLSLIFFNVSEARKKANDAHMKAESSQVARAIYQYREDNGGKVPGHLSVTGPATLVEGSDETGAAYRSAMQELVAGGYLSEVPTSPSGDAYAYIISADESEAVFVADLNEPNSGTNSCPLTEADEGESGGGTDPCTEPEYPPEYADVYGTSFDYVSGNYYPTPKLHVPNLPGTCDIVHNYDYGFYQLAGILEYGEYDCIELPGGISQAQTICELYEPVSGNLCGGLSGPYYNGVNGVFIYHQNEVNQVDQYLQNYLYPYESDYAEYDSCLVEHADEYDEYGDWIGGGDEAESTSLCDGLADTDYCTCV